MNNSGNCVRKCIDFFSILGNELLIITDDIHLPFGKFRIKESGSAGGHNGLKSIENILGHQDYSRLRIGIDNSIGDLSDYVLSDFNKDELEKIPEIITKTIEVLDFWIKSDIARAKEYASNIII